MWRTLIKAVNSDSKSLQGFDLNLFLGKSYFCFCSAIHMNNFFDSKIRCGGWLKKFSTYPQA